MLIDKVTEMEALLAFIKTRVGNSDGSMLQPAVPQKVALSILIRMKEYLLNEVAIR